MKKREMNRYFLCPWCGKGGIMADDKAKVTLSVQCAKCRRIYRVDLDTGKTEKAKAQMRLEKRR